MEIDGESLRQHRECAFLTQAELADKAGVTVSTVNRLENELQLARISTVRKLALALGVSPATLVREGKAAA